MRLFLQFRLDALALLLLFLSLSLCGRVCVCVVTRYFNDYNTLESTFLTCGILVLLGGIAYSVATFSSQVYFDILEYIVLLIVVVSTVICAFTILTELAQSIKYFALASQANRRMKVRPGVRWYPFDAASGVIENRFMV